MVLEMMNTLTETTGGLSESVGTVADAGGMSAALELDISPMSQSLGMELEMVDSMAIEPIADYRQGFNDRLVLGAINQAEDVLHTLKDEAERWDENNIG